MHNTSKILCVGAIVFAFTPAHAEICTDFDDDFNVIEYECGTSLKEAVQIQKQAKKAKQAAEEKAQREAEIAEQKRIEQKAAAEKAQREAERIAQEKRKAEEKADRKKQSEQYWAESSWLSHPFISIGYGFTSVGNMHRGLEDFDGPVGQIEEKVKQFSDSDIDLKIGVNYRPSNSLWEYGLRLGMTGFTHSDKSNTTGWTDEFHVDVTEYFLDATAGYNIINNLNLYGGLGLGLLEIERINTYKVSMPFDEGTIKTNKTSFNIKALIGAEYWFRNHFAIYGEGSILFGEIRTLSAGIKARW